jgi:hypothetical protein
MNKNKTCRVCRWPLLEENSGAWCRVCQPSPPSWWDRARRKGRDLVAQAVYRLFMLLFMLFVLLVLSAIGWPFWEPGF